MIPQECGGRRKDSLLQKYFNSQGDRYIENKLIDASIHIEVHKAIKALKNRKSVGSDKTSGEIWKRSADWLATFAAHILNQCDDIYTGRRKPGNKE